MALAATLVLGGTGVVIAVVAAGFIAGALRRVPDKLAELIKSFALAPA